MADLSLKLTAFEGPLDLLLHLIERDKVDIYDIPIAAVTEQYISYLRSMSEFDMEVASDFLVMAATLLQIKSRMLLPKQSAEGEEEEADPRQQLVEMLVEYRRIKRAAAALADMKQSADLYWQREPMFGNLVERTVAPCTVQQLLKALAGMMTAPDGKPAAFIEPQAYSVQDKMADILQTLQRQPQGFMLNEIFTAGSPAEKVACFLGVLELLKLGLITISQAQRFAPIYIFGKQGQEEANDVS